MHDVGHLVEVARRHRHVVSEVEAHPVLAPKPLEVLDEPPAVGLQLGFAAGPRDPVTAEHQRVKVPGETQGVEPARTVRGNRQPLQVVVVKIAVGHAHRLAVVALHRQQRRGVILGPEQRHLAPDQLGVLAGAAHLVEVRHLGIDLADGVGAVSADLVGLAGVVARGAGQIAAGEHAVSALAARRTPAEQLRRSTHRLGQLPPAAAQRRLGLVIDRARARLQLAQPPDAASETVCGSHASGAGVTFTPCQNAT